MDQLTYTRNGLAIINPYGGVWTDEIFQTPEDAMKYLTSFWNGKNDRLKEYKLAVATLTITLDRTSRKPMTDKTRMLLVESDRAVCVGGKWDGWLFWLHPNGNWVSARKLPETEPTIDPLFSDAAIAHS